MARGAVDSRLVAGIVSLVILIGVLVWVGRGGSDGSEPADPRVEALVADARTAFEEGEIDQALGLIDEAIAQDPDHGPLHYRRGNVLAGARRWEEAGEAYERALAIDPDTWEVYSAMMHVWNRTDRCDEAIARLEDFLSRHPDHARAIYARGFCHYRDGRTEAAYADVKRACELGHEPGCEMADKYGKPARIVDVVTPEERAAQAAEEAEGGEE